MCLNLLMFKMLSAASIYSGYGEEMHFRRALARFQALFFSFCFFFVFFCDYFN